jgi:hypothetical protein
MARRKSRIRGNAASEKLFLSRWYLEKDDPRLAGLPWYDPLDPMDTPEKLPSGALIEKHWRQKKRRLRKDAQSCGMIAFEGGLGIVSWLPVFTISETEWIRSRAPEILQARLDEGENLSPREKAILLEASLGL